MTSADDLISLVRDYNPKTNEARLRDAYAFGEEMHGGQFAIEFRVKHGEEICMKYGSLVRTLPSKLGTS